MTTGRRSASGRAAALAHSPRRHRLRGRGYFKRLGPGIITGAADDDPSGIGTYSQVGAAYGLGLVWSAVFVAPMAIAVQECAARLGLHTGCGLGTLIRRRFPAPVLYLALGLVLVANTFNIAADVGAMAAATHLVVPIPAAILVIALTVGMLVLVVLMPYHRYSRVLRWLTVSLLAYPIVLFSIDVDWAGVVQHAFVPRLVGGAGGLAALVAVFGTTVSPYLFFWQASEEVEEEGEHPQPAEQPGPADDKLREEHLRAMRVDVTGGMLSAVLIAFVIIVVTASTLHRAGITTVATAPQAADALAPVAGDLARLIFAVGIVGLGLLAVPVLAGASAYALAESFGWREGLSRTFRQARGFYVVLGASMMGGLVLALFAIDPIRALYYAAILNGLAAPPLLVIMLVLGRDRRLMGKQRSGRLSTAVLTITLVASVAAPIAWLVTS